METRTQTNLEEAEAWAACPERRGQPGAAVRRTVMAGIAASALLGGSAASLARLAGEAPATWGPIAAAAVSGGALACASCLSPHWPGVRRRLPPGHAVALTFDDGPSPTTTPHILDALAARGARATFFVLGAEAERFPDILERIARDGHTIGVHGWDHRPMTWVRPAEALSLLERAREVVEGITREIVGLYRSPWGHRGPATRFALHRLGWQNIGWRLAARDWRAQTPEAVVRRVEAAVCPRDIVLLHDAGPGADMTAAAMPCLLDALERRGFTLASCVALA